MSKYTIFFGDVALDEYYRTDSWPELGGKAFIDQMEPQHGGMIANAACVYAALGGNAKFMTPLNRGNVSKILIEGLEQSGVAADYVIWDDSLADSKCIIFLTEDNNTVMIVNVGLTEIELSEEYFAALEGAEFIYSTLSDLLRLRYGELKGLEVISKIRESGVKVVCDLDTGYLENDYEENYRELDYAIFNNIGFDRYRGERSEKTAIEDLLSYGISVIAITRGEDGCSIYTKDESYNIPSYKVDAIDVTGAGDTFSASLLYGLQHFSVKEAAEFASATAAICVEGIGARAGAVSEKEVISFMENHA